MPPGQPCPQDETVRRRLTGGDAKCEGAGARRAGEVPVDDEVGRERPRQTDELTPVHGDAAPLPQPERTGYRTRLWQRRDGAIRKRGLVHDGRRAPRALIPTSPPPPREAGDRHPSEIPTDSPSGTSRKIASPRASGYLGGQLYLGLTAAKLYPVVTSSGVITQLAPAPAAMRNADSTNFWFAATSASVGDTCNKAIRNVDMAALPSLQPTQRLELGHASLSTCRTRGRTINAGLRQLLARTYRSCDAASSAAFGGHLACAARPRNPNF